MSICLYRYGSGMCAATIAVNHGCAYAKPVQYESTLPLLHIQPGEIVYLFNVTSAPYDLEELSKLAKEVHFFDHRLDLLEEMQRFGHGIIVHGDGTKSMTEEVWDYFCPGQPIPLSAKLQGQYIMWDLVDPQVLNFFYGSKTLQLSKEQTWVDLLNNTSGCVDRVLVTGEGICKYFTKRDQIIAKDLVYKTTIDGLPALVANTRICNSLMFDQVKNVRDVADNLAILYQWDPKHHVFNFTLSKLKTKNDDSRFSVGELARKYNGGGSVDVGGFRCERNKFPFNIHGTPEDGTMQYSDDLYQALNDEFLRVDGHPGIRNVLQNILETESIGQSETRIGTVPIVACNLPHLAWQVNRWHTNYSGVKLSWVWEPWMMLCGNCNTTNQAGAYRLMIEPCSGDQTPVDEILSYLANNSNFCIHHQNRTDHRVVLHTAELPFEP